MPSAKDRPHHPLHDLLRKELPSFHNQRGEMNASKLSRALECSRANVLAGITTKGCVSSRIAQKLITLSEGRISGEEIIKYIR